MGRCVLLISVNQYDFPYPVFPLGLAQLQAALHRAGHKTRLVDWNLEQPPIPELIRDVAPDVVGISLRNVDDALILKREVFFEQLKRLCAELHAASPAPIVLGGSGFSIFPENLLEFSGADYGIQGEGERPFLHLIEALRQGEDPTGIPSLVHRNQNGIVVNPPRNPMPAAEIPTPQPHQELAQFYLQRSSMLNVQTQRGCALHCCYCTYPLIEGRTTRRRSPETVADELQQLQQLGARYVFIVDSVFNSSKDHAANICEAILQRGLSLKWCCFLRPKNLTSDLMQLMARAGLTHAEFGSDSFCDSVLESYGKHLTFDDILHSSQLARLHNVDYAHFIICGGPGETRESLHTSFANSRHFHEAPIMARVGMRVYPGTPLHARVKTESHLQPAPDLLQPFYYLAPNLSQTEIFAMLHKASADLPNWIFQDPPPAYFKMAERLRARGIVGPLWSYFAMLQRLGATLSARPAP
jgi:radical SAM superfamily enzyme YgiQ (UPF0313 family)